MAYSALLVGLTFILLSSCTSSETEPLPSNARECGGVKTPAQRYGRRADFPPSIPLPGCIDGSASNYLTPESQLDGKAAAELHVVAVYEGQTSEPRNFGQPHPGTIDVAVQARPKPVVLFLTSFEPVRWRLSVAPGAAISRVFVSGISSASSVDGLSPGIPVVSLPGVCMYGWEVSANDRNGDGCGFWQAIEEVRRRTRLIESSFQGCYGGSHFEIPYRVGPATLCSDHLPGDEAKPNSAVEFPGCEAVASESSYCVTREDEAIWLVGLDTGRRCHVVNTKAPLSLALDSSAWRGEILYACTDDGLVRISLRDGSWESAQFPCDGVSRRGDRLVLMPSSNDQVRAVGVDPFQSYETDQALLEYRDYDSLLRGDYTRTPDLAPVSLFAVHGDLAYLALPSTNAVEIGDLITGRFANPVRLEGYDGRVFSLAVTDHNELIIQSHEALLVFDATTGIRKRTLPFGEPRWTASGLACAARPGTSPPPISSVPASLVRECGGMPIPVPLYGRRADFPRSIPLSGCISRKSSNYLTPASQLDSTAAAELHVVSVYQGQTPTGQPFKEQAQGTIDVAIHARPKPVVLFLSSYMSVRWRLNLAPGATVTRVVTSGASEQVVEGVASDVLIDHLGWSDGITGMYGWEVGSGGHDIWTSDMTSGIWMSIETIRRRLGLTESSFQGCYEGSHFDIPHAEGPAPLCSAEHVPGDEALPNDEVHFAGCDNVISESAYCLTQLNGTISLVGLNSGARCSVVTTSAPLSPSIAWRGEILYACGGAGLTRISLRDGSWEAAQLPCNAMSTRGNEFIVMPSWMDPLNRTFASQPPLLQYADYEAILLGKPKAIFSNFFSGTLLPTFGTGLEPLAVHGDRAYTAWDATDTVNVGDLTTGQLLAPIKLQGYYGWILGMAVTDQGELVISGDAELMVFDAVTGARKRSFASFASEFGGPIGLACVVRH